MDSPEAAGLAITISLFAIAIWGLFFLRLALVLIRRQDRRVGMAVMPLTGLLASIGTFASAVLFAQASGLFTIHIDPEAFILVAAMGRGALLMGGIIAFAFYNPKDHG